MLNKVGRRQLLKAMGLSAGGAILAACQPKVIEKVVRETVEVEKIVKETVEVEKKVEKIVEKEVTKIVEAKAAPPETITLRVMTRAGAGGGDGMRHFCKQFDDEHPNITVVTEDTLYQEMQKKQELGLVTGTMPDAIFSQQRWYHYACHMGFYQAIDAHIQADPLEFDDYYPSLVEACRFEGRLYGLPGGYAHPNTRELLVYNRELCEQAGVSWPVDKNLTMEDWKEIVLKATRPNDNIFGTMMQPHVYYDFDCVVLQPLGGRIFDAEMKKLQILDDQKTSDAIQWYLEMVDGHGTPRRGELLETGNMFLAGRLATHNAGVGIVGTIAALEKDGKMFEWDWTLVPVGPEGRGTCTWVLPWCVYSGTRYPRETYELICLLTSYEFAVWDAVNTGLSPNGSRGAWYSDEVALLSPAYLAVAEWLEEDCLPYPTPWNLRDPEFFDTFRQNSEPVFYGERTWKEQAPILWQAGQEVLDLPRP